MPGEEKEVSPVFADLHPCRRRRRKKKNKGLERKENFLFLVFKMVQELQRKKSLTWEGKHSAL